MNLSPKNQPGAAASRSQIGLARRQALDTLLLSLSTDDAARSAFIADPLKVLAAHGLDFDPEEIPRERRLPSKETLAAARKKMLADSEPEGDFFIIFPSKHG